MEMEGLQTISLPLKDFRDKCRICLRNHSDMTDVLTSGISDTVMEVINIKINWNDELPTLICQECKNHIEIFYDFKTLAKNSDNYLRALLLAEKCFGKETENNEWELSSQEGSKVHNGDVRKNIDCNYSDKMYIIQVNKGTENSGSQNEIFIKDLESENENMELTNFCRLLINSRSGEYNDILEELEKNLFDDLAENAENLMDKSFCNNVTNVDWFIYQCNKCNESFQSTDCLSQHLSIVHNDEVSMSSISYKCRVCATSMDDDNLFLEHLKAHETEGLSLSKVDGSEWCISPEYLKNEIFEASKSFDFSAIKNKVFKVNTSCYRCFLCEKLEPAESINDHLKVCFPDLMDEENNVTIHLKFTCPACFTSWIDDCEEFKQHLLSHGESNVFFVKVNNLGESVDLTEEDFMFTPFEKVLEVLKFGEDETGVFGNSKIIKMRNLFSCQICNFETTSINLLSEHYLESHDSARAISCVCPVCCEDFKFFDLCEISKFQSHIINHKEEGIYFLKVNSNGSIANDGPDSSGIFSDVSDFLLGKVQCPELEYMSSIFVPTVITERTADCAAGECLAKKEDVAHLKAFTTKENKYTKGYICEKCGKEFAGKANYRKHFLTHGKDAEASNQKRPKCSVCGKIFSNRAILIEHKRHHLGDERDTAEDSSQTICEICGKGLPSNASLAKHRRLHVREKEKQLLKCKICDRTFRRESALNRHLSAHLNPNYFECEECKLPLPSLASLERHKLGHQSTAKTHDCKECNVSFLSKERLTAHETHTGHNQNRKRFECNVCHESFFIGREFTKHIKLHPKYKMSECALCGKRLSTMQSLMLHLDRHFESNSILCPHCGKQCFEERNYRRHLLTHKGVKPFACDVEGCDKSFYTFFEVKRHKKYHNNTRDFGCPYCSKRFHEANHLKVHIRTHTGERPYTCPHCNKSFVTRTRCKQHISLVHQGVGYDLIQSTISKKVAVFEAIDAPA